MSDWSDYFSSYMQNPDLIKENELFHETMLLARNHSLPSVANEVLEMIHKADPPFTLHFKGNKYLYLSKLDEAGYSRFLYKKLKREEEEGEENSETLFISRINKFLWIGSFDDSKKAYVFEHVDRVSTAISPANAG